MRKLLTLLFTSLFLASLVPSATFAQDWHGRFHDHGYDHWRGGHWFNGFHDGRTGWWWIVDGFWYFYPAPIYPYPDPYTPPTVVVQTAPAAPATVVTQSPAPAPVSPTRYYCANPAGYYPDVPQCAGGWQPVSATATAAPPPAQPVAPAQSPARSQHDIDMQQLNVYAANLQSIDQSGSHVRSKLKDLEKQVEDFRQSLYNRDYNAMDVLKDAEDLKKRIADQRAWLAQHKDAAVPPELSVAPAPSSLPPGTPVTFPPQQ